MTMIDDLGFSLRIRSTADFCLMRYSNPFPDMNGDVYLFFFLLLVRKQVPKGWDKLFVSVTSEQTGKTIVKTSKGSVRNGSCQWSESISESISVSQDEPSKEFEDFNYKLVVAMVGTVVCLFRSKPFL